jgi:O-antigen ligase
LSLANAQSISRYALVEFFWVLTCCIALSVFPELGWFLLAVTFLPIAIRLIWNYSSFKSSALNYLLPLFLITSFMGLLVAYNQDQAVHKFVLIVLSILLFYSLTYQTQENLWIIAIGLGVFGALTTIIFVLTNNWSTFPADFQFVEDFGNWWTKLGTGVELESYNNAELFHANIVAGINAILLPLSAATTIHFWRSRNNILFAINLSILLFLIIGLIITSSRAAWVATIFGLLFFAGLTKSTIRDFLTIRKFVIVLISISIIAMGVFTPLLIPDYINNSTLQISEVTSFDSRVQLASQTYFLIADFPFTGGGLGSFPGLYSQYILSIPFFMFGYSHNLYLDLMLEQGIFGFVLWVLIIIACFSTLRTIFQQKYHNGASTLFASAIFSGLIILLIHGIIDDPIYSSTWGLPMLFVFPGLTIALTENDSVILLNSASNKLFPIIVILVLVTTAFIVFRNQIIAKWYANIGAINLAKIELADWPTNEWNEPVSFSVYDQAENFFTRSLSLQETNLTANYRQGLVWMARHDFQEALPYLETALKKRPEHRGIRKNLGYSYTWLGKYEQAELVLEQIPEAQTEMKVYQWLWQNQGRYDLADKAVYMANLLSSN